MRAARLEQHRAKRAADGRVPVGRLHVGDPVLELRRHLEMVDRGVPVSLHLFDPHLEVVLRDAKEVARRQVLGLETVEVGGLDQRLDGPRLLPRLLDASRASQRRAAGVVPEPLDERELVRRLLQRQDRLGVAELGMHRERRRADRLDPGEVGRDLVRRDLVEPFGRGKRILRKAGGLRADQQEVHVVRVVAIAVELARGLSGTAEEGLVRGDGVAVHLDRVGVAADPVVDVRRHVHEMPRRRHRAGQPVGRVLSPPRVRRCLHRMDVEMQRGGMVGRERQRAVERRHDVATATPWRHAVRLPVVPRLLVHQRVREDDLHVDVVRKGFGRRLHKVGEVRSAVPAGVARRQSVGQRNLDRRRGEARRDA